MIWLFAPSAIDGLEAVKGIQGLITEEITIITLKNLDKIKKLRPRRGDKVWITSILGDKTDSELWREYDHWLNMIEGYLGHECQP